jgi:hypothetical protein
MAQSADVAPTAQVAAAAADRRKALAALMERWSTLKAQDLPALNGQLKQANLPEVNY